MGSSPAVLIWNGRTIARRVIYEYLMMPEFNRLTRTYWGMWKEYQGLYLTADEIGDLYVHNQLSKRIAPLIGMVAGFVAFKDLGESMHNLKVETQEREMALGFYRWLTAWCITWTSPQGPDMLCLALSERHRVANWVIGGFSMGIVRGVLDYAGEKHPMYGLAVLII